MGTSPLCFLHIPQFVLTAMTSVKLTTPQTGEFEQPTGLFINNEFVKAVDGKTFDVINPSTEEVICSVQEATEKDVDIAVAAARKAFNGPWRKETPENRGKLLNKLADLFEKNADLIAAVEALDNGKAFSMAKNVDVPAAAGCLRYYGGWADKIEGKVVYTAPDSFNYIRKEPIGVCGQIIPWNFPILMWSWKIGPAIAAHMDIDKIAFTGSTVVGCQIMKSAAGSN